MLVALASFAVWAFSGRLFDSEKAMYAGCAAVLLGFGGAALLPGSGLSGFKKVANWCLSFAVAFTIYAIVWSVAWFTFQDTFGEILGSAVGIFCLVIVLKYWMKFDFSIGSVTAVVFLCHSLGYYGGELAYDSIQGRGPLGMELRTGKQQIAMLAKLAWGLGYGLGFGAGMSCLLQMSRQSFDRPSRQI